MFTTVGCHLEAHACICKVIHSLCLLTAASSTSSGCLTTGLKWVFEFTENISAHRFQGHMGNNGSRVHRLLFVLCSFTVAAALNNITISIVDLLALSHTVIQCIRVR